MLSVIIPTLNAEKTLPATLAALFHPAMGGVVKQVIIADGGSTDATKRIAEETGCDVVTAKPGRGGQMIAGAAKARGDWLLFLHADTVPETGWEKAVRGFIARHGDCVAGFFRFALDDKGVWPAILERGVALRQHLFALPYGDQGLLMSRHLYDEIGGFADLPIMEDVEIVHRLGRARLKVIPARAVTSAERYARDGYLARVLRNWRCLIAYYRGVPPAEIVRRYR